MAWALLFLTFLTCYPGSDSQYTLTQPATQTASLEQTAKLACPMSGDRVTSRTIYWYQQRDDLAPRFVLYGTSSRGDGIPDRFTGSQDSSANTAYLTIAGIKAGDEAVYYCAGAYSSGSTWRYVFGGGTHLTVLGQPTALPSVFLFPPSQEEIKTKSKATLACLMDDFYPGVVQVEWKADGTAISSGVETTKPIKQGDKYVASSYLTLSESDWKSHGKYTCKVTHERGTVEKEVNRADCS